MIQIKSREEIELMRESALIVSKTLGEIAKAIQQGISTLELDKIAEELIRDHGAIPHRSCESEFRICHFRTHWKQSCAR